MKKKETKKERIERIRREAEDSPIVRELRELVRRGKEDLERRRAAEGNHEPVVLDIEEVVRRGKDELARRGARSVE